jgi:uncharacterized membrane protein
MKSFGNRFVSYLLRGLFLLAPVFITAYLVYMMFNSIDTALNDGIERITGFRFPGLGILVGILLITLIGFLSSLFFVKPLFRLFEEVIIHTPGVKVIYSSLKDLFAAFGHEKKFSHPVVVTFKTEGTQRLGFITERNLEHMGLPGKVAVYIPDSYNFSGMLYVVPQEDVREINLPSSEMMKFMVSGGVAHVEKEKVMPLTEPPVKQ